jgi:hypothetical protein
MKRKARALRLSLIVLIIFTAEMTLDSLIKASPLPDISPEIIIKNPQNTTYVGNTILLNFTASSTWISSSISYSLDGSDKIPVNTTTVLQEDANIGKNPAIYRTTVKGTCALSNVSRGWHNITLFMICENKKFSYYETYFEGDIIASESVSFFIGASVDNLFMPAMTLSILIMIIIGIGLLVYFKKHK